MATTIIRGKRLVVVQGKTCRRVEPDVRRYKSRHTVPRFRQRLWQAKLSPEPERGKKEPPYADSNLLP
jgi:hypothetical protein